MMKRFVAAGLIACAALAAPVYGQTNAGTQPAAAAQAAAPTKGLKDAYAGKFLIGTAEDLRGFGGPVSDAVLANIKANYNVITPENCMKPQNVHPEEDTYTWETPDALVKWCSENNIKVWGHTLAWHAQTAQWFFVGPDGKQVSRELAMARLKKHIQTEVGRYKGRLLGWDVVNEAIDDRQTSGESLRRSSWIRAIGPDYLTMAFKWAHEADPNALLFYNDYNIEQGALRNGGKHAASMALLKRLIKDGAPISGVGIQGHWSVNTNLEEVEKAITDYETLGLKIAISELDVTIAGENSGQFPGAPGAGRGGMRRGNGITSGGAPAFNFDAARGGMRRGNGFTSAGAAMRGMRGTRGGRGMGGMRGGRGMGGFGGRGRGAAVPASPAALKRQAEVYAKLFQIFQRHSKSLMRVTLWGTDDSTSWKGGQLPLLYDGQLKPKPAYQAVLDVAENK